MRQLHITKELCLCGRDWSWHDNYPIREYDDRFKEERNHIMKISEEKP